MFDQLTSFVSRPQPFSVYTAPELWTHPHVSQQMLLAHLDPGSDLASRRSSSIESTVEWVDSLLGLKGKKVCDLGCGPGLYATRFHDKGALVTGLDISKRSVSHATSEATKSGRSINFLEADYTNNELPDGMDLYALIYCDFCALSPAQRASLLTRIRSGLADGGHLVMDVCTLQAFETFKESDLVEHRLMDGFWAAGDYVGLMKSFKYPGDKVSLDRYLIIEPNNERHIYNWLQYFDRESLEAELDRAGFAVEVLAGSLTGDALTGQCTTYGVVARAI